MIIYCYTIGPIYVKRSVVLNSFSNRGRVNFGFPLQSWTGNLSPIERDAWIEAATSKTYQISDEVDFERLKMTRFALPLPT